MRQKYLWHYATNRRLLMTHFLASSLLLILFPASFACAQDTRPDYLKAYERSGFPAINDPVQFSDPHAFPPQLKGLTVDKDAKVEFRALEGADIERRMVIATSLAFSDPRVKAVAGQRYASLGGGTIDAEKGPRSANEGDIAVDFYNYDLNRAYRAILLDDRVVSVQPWPKGYQPKETRAEVQAAADIVARNPAHARAITGLSARGLRAPSEGGDRLLYLLFYKGKERPALYEATVNMSKGRVVRAKPLRH
jgi:hypothetical protein